MKVESLGKLESESLEQDGLVLAWLGDATFTDFESGFGGEHDVYQMDLLELGDYFSGFVSQACLPAPLGEGFPQHVVRTRVSAT